jgi:uncharacterized protein YybS (DUF2232 family)
MNSAGYGAIGAVVKGSMLTLALFFLFSTIPFLGAFAGVFIPFPCIYYSLKHSRVTGYAIVLLLIVFLAILDQGSLLVYLIISVPCSIALPELLARGKGTTQTLFITVGLNAFLAAGLTSIAVVLLHSNVDEQIRSMLHETLYQVGETYRSSGLSGKELAGLKDGLQLIEKALARLYPSFVLILFGITAGFNLVLLKRLSASLGKNITFGSFYQYRNPEYLVWLLILAGFSLLADSALLSDIAVNTLFFLYFLYFVQGLAISSWYVRKVKFPRVLQVVFYVVMALQPLLTAIVAVFGLADLWADFRTQKKTENL